MDRLHQPNARVTIILILRIIDQNPWREVAQASGGKETEYSVEEACRYVDGRSVPYWAGNQLSSFDEPETQDL